LKKILIYVSTKSNLNLPTKLGGIESLNYNLFKFLKKNNFNAKLVRDLSLKDKNTIWDIVVSSNDASIFSILIAKKKILWLHNLLQIEKAFRKKQIWSIITNNINAVFVSKYLQNNTSFLYFFSSKIVIDNFLDASFINLKKKFKRKLIYIWSTRRTNGLKDLISSWIDNISLLKNSELHIFGIEKNKLKSELNGSNLSKYNIFIHGFVDKKILVKYYLSSSGIICLGYDETFCLNAIEGNAAGLPILTFGHTNLKNIVVNHQNGFVVKNFKMLITKILYINNLKFNAKIKLINSCYEHSKKFYPNKSFKKWKDILK
jgi:glycosyltransferase involved in cell wall biosynthesis